MTKRIATTELNHDNWNREEEPEEVQIGIPSAASAELKKRVLLTGKRRAGGQSSLSSTTKSVFAGFAGFGKAATNAAENVIQNGSTSCLNSTTSQDEKGGNKIIFVDVDKDSTTPKSGPIDVQCIKNGNQHVTPSTIPPASNFEHQRFCKHVKVLNNSVLHWIDHHVKNNPYLDLRPVFKDYIDHYKALEEKFQSPKKQDRKPTTVTNGSIDQKAVEILSKPRESIFTSLTPPTSTDNLKENGQSVDGGKYDRNVDESSNDVQSTAAPTFSFGFNGNGQSSETLNNDSKTTVVETSSGICTTSTTANLFSFGNANKDSTDNVGEKPSSLLFSFLNQPMGTGGSTSNSNDAPKTDVATDEDNAEYQPPKPESVQIEEKDAYHSVKCKLFYKSGTKYAEKGVGTLHLKKLDNGKTQLLIRTDTALGNILLNVCLSEATPCSKINKNNLTLACVPNPPLELAKKDDRTESDEQQPKTAIMLIRISEHGPITRSKRARSILMHFNGVFATTVAALGRSRSNAISP
uniref:Nuclear pore complex NUP2/50/61 domain-containing protein n=1 Tax=Romanomermis culicivorax TaxID=13658 RepID=A0A915IK75_ROMCU